MKDTAKVDGFSHNFNYGDEVSFKIIYNTVSKDINECWNGNHNCRSIQQCLNTPGSFRCVDFCSKGFTLHNNGSCVG